MFFNRGAQGLVAGQRPFLPLGLTYSRPFLPLDVPCVQLAIELRKRQSILSFSSGSTIARLGAQALVVSDALSGWLLSE